MGWPLILAVLLLVNPAWWMRPSASWTITGTWPGGAGADETEAGTEGEVVALAGVANVPTRPSGRRVEAIPKMVRRKRRPTMTPWCRDESEQSYAIATPRPA